MLPNLLNAPTGEVQQVMCAVLQPHVNTLMVATALYQLEAERKNEIEKKVLKKGDFWSGLERHIGGVRRITDPKDTWKIRDEHATAYFNTLIALDLLDGYEVASEGKCPALVAKSHKLEAEQLLVAAAEVFFPGVTWHKLLCLGLDKLDKYIDLLVGLVLQAPNYERPNLKEFASC